MAITYNLVSKGTDDKSLTGCSLLLRKARDNYRHPEWLSCKSAAIPYNLALRTILISKYPWGQMVSDVASPTLFLKPKAELHDSAICIQRDLS